MRRTTAMYLLLFAPRWGFAQDCAPLTSQGLQVLVERAGESLDRDDIVGHGDAYREIRERLPCLEEPLASRTWAEFLLGTAIIEHALERDWETPLAAALQADPDLDRSRSPRALVDFPVPPPPRSLGAHLTKDAVYFLDGHEIDEVPVLRGLHVVQRFADDRWDTRLLEDAPFPSEWTQGLEADAIGSTAHAGRGRAALLVTGGVLTAVGVTAGAGTWVYGHSGTVLTHTEAGALESANIVGWSAALLGVGVGTVSLLLPARDRAVAVGTDGRGLRIAGRF